MSNTSANCLIVNWCMMLALGLALGLLLLTFDNHIFGIVDQCMMLVLELVLELVLIVFDDHTFGTSIGHISSSK